MRRQIFLLSVLMFNVAVTPSLVQAAPWLSVVNTPAEIHFIPESGDGEIIALGDKVIDVQAVRISQGGKPYIVALLKHKRRLTLNVYNYTGQRLTQRIVRTVQEPYRIGAARLEHVTSNGGSTMQIRYINVNDNTDEPVTYLRQRYLIKPNGKKIITKKTTVSLAITEPTWPTTETTDDIIDFLGAARLSAGLLPVKYSSSINAGCVLHAEYMRLNDDMTHYEDSTKPGYTEAGAAAGLESVLTYQYSSSMIAAIDLWLEAPYHRFALLQPELVHIGWAVSDPLNYNEFYDKYFTCLNSAAGTETVASGYEKNTTYWEHQNHEPIPYPGVNQINVPTTFYGNETPDPLDAFDGTYPAGYAISLIFSDNDEIDDVAITVTDEAGKTIAGYVRGPDDPTDPNTLYQGNATLFIAEEPLDYSTTYMVTVTAQRNSKDYEKTWNFRPAAE
jgi:uncharacterized protein YkwD